MRRRRVAPQVFGGSSWTSSVFSPRGFGIEYRPPVARSYKLGAFSPTGQFHQSAFREASCTVRGIPARIPYRGGKRGSGHDRSGLFR